MEKETYSPDREADQTLLGAMLGLWRLEIGRIRKRDFMLTKI